MQSSISQLRFAILAENKAIQEELRKYSSLPPQICHAINLLNSTKGNLMSIKKKVGNNDYYIELSTLVVSNALHCIVQKVNEAQKEKSEENLAQVVFSAWQAILLMDSFDRERNFEVHYLSNRETLFGIYKQIIHSNSIYQDMVEYYKAIDVFNGTVKKVANPPKQKQTFSNPLIREGVLGDTDFSKYNTLYNTYNTLGIMGVLERGRQFRQVTELLDKVSNPLRKIKSSQTISNQEYLQLSTRVVSLALNKVIELVNYNISASRTSYHRQYGLDTELNSSVSNAYIAILKMSSFDMLDDFKKHFDEQKRTIVQMSERTNPLKKATLQNSSSGGGSGCMLMLCAIVGVIILAIYGCL